MLGACEVGFQVCGRSGETWGFLAEVGHQERGCVLLSRSSSVWGPDLSVPEGHWTGGGAGAGAMRLGLGGADQPGAALIWGLALTSKLVTLAPLECPAMVGVKGRRLVPIKLQRVTVASWGL